LDTMSTAKPDCKTLAQTAAMVLYKFVCKDNFPVYYSADDIYKQLRKKNSISVSLDHIKWALYEEWVRDGMKNYAAGAQSCELEFVRSGKKGDIIGGAFDRGNQIRFGLCGTYHHPRANNVAAKLAQIEAVILASNKEEIRVEIRVTIVPFFKVSTVTYSKQLNVTKETQMLSHQHPKIAGLVVRRKFEWKPTVLRRYLH